MIYEFDWTQRTIACANPPQEGRPSPEEVRRRLFGARGDEHAGQRPPHASLLRWLAHVFQDRERAWVSVWGARATTDKLEARGAIRRRPGPPGSGDEQIRLTRYGRELVLGLDRENPSADERRRAAERSGDPVAQLRERLRRGEVTTEQARVAAALGDERAGALEPPTDLPRGADGQVEAIYLVGRALGDLDGLAASYAADCAEHVTPVWTRSYGNDALLRNAIEAARRWVRERSADAANEARRAVREILLDNDFNNASARVYYAGRAAAYAGETAYVRNTDIAASNTLYAAYAASDDDAENEWQRRRLIAYVLGEA